MKKIVLILIMVSINIFAELKYDSWERLLTGYVCQGGVDYNGLKGKPELVKNIDLDFKKLTRSEFDNLSKKGQLAWLINLYNFYTIKLILANLPLNVGIRDIAKPWDQKAVPFFGKTVSLNYIEHTIIRKKYAEPRIHFALVCASVACPELSNKLFTEKNLDILLNLQAKNFLSDKSKNRIESNKILLSKIFSWYGGDFKANYGSYQNYIKEILGLNGKYAIKFIPYDWSLNNVSGCKP